MLPMASLGSVAKGPSPQLLPRREQNLLHDAAQDLAGISVDELAGSGLLARCAPLESQREVEHDDGQRRAMMQSALMSLVATNRACAEAQAHQTPHVLQGLLLEWMMHAACK